jgi:hypothetical protein
VNAATGVKIPFATNSTANAHVLAKRPADAVIDAKKRQTGKIVYWIVIR